MSISEYVVLAKMLRRFYKRNQLTYIGKGFIDLNIEEQLLSTANSGFLLLIGTIMFGVASMIDNYQAMIKVLGAIFTGAGLILAGIKVRYG